MKFIRIVLNPAVVASATVLLSHAPPSPENRAPCSRRWRSGIPSLARVSPNPAPTVTANWGDLPAGREWDRTAGVDIDPTDGHVWAYERCASGSAGGPGINCESNAVDPIFKFDRNTGEVLANIGAGIFVTPHGHPRSARR